jgi:hypothetical protein
VRCQSLGACPTNDHLLYAAFLSVNTRLFRNNRTKLLLDRFSEELAMASIGYALVSSLEQMQCPRNRGLTPSFETGQHDLKPLDLEHQAIDLHDGPKGKLEDQRHQNQNRRG